MVFPLYFALTAGEFRLCDAYPSHCAWLSCHFSSCGPSLTNLPQRLPKGSMLIIDDSTPISGHQPQQIAEQLNTFLSTSCADSVLLDFQRPPTPESLAMAKALTELPCPVGVSESHGKDLDCPVFLPPPPLHLPLHKYIEPWQNREIWLEVALGQEYVEITGEGLRQIADCPKTGNSVHYSQALACHYQIIPELDRVRFIFNRTREDLSTLLSFAESLGITYAIGLYQELHQNAQENS